MANAKKARLEQIQYNAKQSNAMQSNPIQSNAIKSKPIQHNTTAYSTTQQYTKQCNAIQYFINHKGAFKGQCDVYTFSLY